MSKCKKKKKKDLQPQRDKTFWLHLGNKTFIEDKKRMVAGVNHSL